MTSGYNTLKLFLKSHNVLTASSWQNEPPQSNPVQQIASSPLKSKFYAGGIFDTVHCSSTKVAHAVLIVGYGEYSGKKYWLVKKQVKYTTPSACVHYIYVANITYTLKEVMLMWLKICYFSRVNEHLKYAEILLGVGQEFLYSLEHCSFWRTNTYVVSSAIVIHALGILHSPNTCAWGDITKQHSWLTHSS